MKKYLPTINLFLIITLFGIVFFFINKVKLLSSFNEGEVIPNDVGFNFILGKLDSNFTLVLTTIAVLFGFVVFLSSRVTHIIIKTEVRAIKKKAREQEAKYKKLYSSVHSFKGDLDFEVAEKHNDYRKTFKEDNKVLFIEFSITSCEYYAKSLLFKNDVNEKFKNDVELKIKNILNDAVSEISKHNGNMLLINMGVERYMRAEQYINQVGTIMDKQNLSFIFSKLDFPNLD